MAANSFVVLMSRDCMKTLYTIFYQFYSSARNSLFVTWKVLQVLPIGSTLLALATFLTFYTL